MKSSIMVVEKIHSPSFRYISYLLFFFDNSSHSDLGSHNHKLSLLIVAPEKGRVQKFENHIIKQLVKWRDDDRLIVVLENEGCHFLAEVDGDSGKTSIIREVKASEFYFRVSPDEKYYLSGEIHTKKETITDKLQSFVLRRFKYFQQLPFFDVVLSNKTNDIYEFSVKSLNEEDNTDKQGRYSGNCFEWIDETRLAGQNGGVISIIDTITHQAINCIWDKNSSVLRFYPYEDNVLFIALKPDGISQLYKLELSTNEISLIGFDNILNLLYYSENLYFYEKVEDGKSVIYESDTVEERKISESGIVSSAVYSGNKDLFYCLDSENDQLFLTTAGRQGQCHRINTNFPI
ncbi:MAG: hypothetical protein LWY06_13370 [Firmicutes bacterium]|nr:hypothetical protein [Bacillota bacterium]